MLTMTIGSFKRSVAENGTTARNSIGCSSFTLQTEVPQDLHRNDGDSYMYRQSIRILPSFESNDIAQALVFNLALAYHLSSQKSISKHQLLKKAVSLYELAFQIQMRKPATMSNNLFFPLALMNNIGLIHKELNHQAAASSCFRELLSLLMYSKECGMSVDINGRCLEGFYENALDSECQNMPASAA